MYLEINGMKAPLKTLFLIDDDELYLFTMKKMVEKNKLVDNLHEFHNGFDAIEFLNLMAANKYVLPDVILLDINMPVMDGWTFMELFSLLKPKLEKQISVFMITSSIDPEDLIRAKAIEDITDFIVKPIASQQLINIFNIAV